MRIFLLLAFAGAWWVWHLHAPPAEPQAPSEPPAVAAGAPDHSDDPLVHCVFGEDSTFLRQEECTSRGGRVDEPSWARLR